MQYRPELDGLRAIAVVLVVLFHADGQVSGGFIGVDLFFVLSAFLITSLLASEWGESGVIDLKRFCWRRFLRLMPALLLLLATYLVVAPFVWPGHNHPRDPVLTGLISAITAMLWLSCPSTSVTPGRFRWKSISTCFGHSLSFRC